jgi:L-ascorbate metabolism protein UlaG (beta-lactamase superfamily)
MSPVHMAPEEAIRAHEILGAKTSGAIHHGTFQLADDGIDTAEKHLVACRRDDSFLILKNGQFANIALQFITHFSSDWEIDRNREIPIREWPVV